MSTGRVTFLQELIDTIERMIVEIEERETIDPDLGIVRELAEQLRSELDALT